MTEPSTSGRSSTPSTRPALLSCPIWDTELNYGLAGPGPENPLQKITGSKARDWVVQTAFDSLALGLSRTYWYIWTRSPTHCWDCSDQRLRCGKRPARRRSVDRRCHDPWVHGRWFGDACPIDKQGVPSLIAWADDGDGSLIAPPGYTQVCTTANRCTPIEGPVTVDGHAGSTPPIGRSTADHDRDVLWSA